MQSTPELERVRALVAPIASDLSLDLYDVERRGGTVRITLDTPPGSPGGVTLDDLSLATRLIGRELDHSDPIPGKYTLEVTSPGLERPLRTPAHFQREIGKDITVRLRDVVDGERRIDGVLVSADEDGFVLRQADPGATDNGSRDVDAERRVAYHQVDKARTLFEWGPAPKPGKGAGQKRQKGAGQKGQKGAGQKGDKSAGTGNNHAGTTHAGSKHAGKQHKGASTGRQVGTTDGTDNGAGVRVSTDSEATTGSAATTGAEHVTGRETS